MDADPRDDQQAAIDRAILRHRQLEAERLRKLLQKMRLPRWNAPLGRVSNHPARDEV